MTMSSSTCSGSFAVRDGLNIARYAMKRLHRNEAADAADAVDTALILAIGPDADLFLIGPQS